MNQQRDEEFRTEDSEVEDPLGSAHVRNWSPWYARCPRWGENWARMHANDETFEWPEGTRIVEGRMFLGHKTCIPTPLQKEWIRAVHEVQGHVGFPRMWKILEDHYECGSLAEAKNFARRVAKECDTCQACRRPKNRYGPITHAPIPPAIMACIAIAISSPRL